LFGFLPLTSDAYFRLIGKSIFEFGGDIQKYAGDAVFAEWRTTSLRSAADCARLGAICACKLSDELSDYPITVQSGSETLRVKMNHHCGVGFGSTVGIHIGDDTHCREYLL